MRKIVFLAPLAITALLVFIAVGGVIVRWLWNWLLPPLFGWHTIGFWQALGLLALCRILFGGFGVHGPGRGRRRMMEDRWDRMSAEERERFREHIRERSGTDPAAEGIGQ